MGGMRSMTEGSRPGLPAATPAPSPVMIDAVQFRLGAGRAPGLEWWMTDITVVKTAMADREVSAADVDGLHDRVDFGVRYTSLDEGA